LPHGQGIKIKGESKIIYMYSTVSSWTRYKD